MKTTLMIMYILLALQVSVYFAVSVHQLTFNPLSWSPEARVLPAVALGLIVFFGLAAKAGLDAED